MFRNQNRFHAANSSSSAARATLTPSTPGLSSMITGSNASNNPQQLSRSPCFLSQHEHDRHYEGRHSRNADLNAGASPSKNQPKIAKKMQSKQSGSSAENIDSGSDTSFLDQTDSEEDKTSGIHGRCIRSCHQRKEKRPSSGRKPWTYTRTDLVYPSLPPSIPESWWTNGDVGHQAGWGPYSSPMFRRQSCRGCRDRRRKMRKTQRVIRLRHTDSSGE